ncbi:helix-turn-helix domain-containing protein [Adlercreutzia caecimuris]|jgi:transcriptional regulator with XRE-family HTH domain/desulfoferrodoxin (superoxide reductase-like protein)|uniref:helix-turn-helix domain-containing protein n=2 Tax=Adlercreutzia caecimuris TaxID=671266 RepID=UPI002570CEE3|nr:helix-turn-helix domain-containing protein [Adlercreutzia caecimuris]
MTSYISGASIRALRERAGMTQRHLADQLGITDKAVSKWETDRGLPDITLVEPLACALGVSVAELLSGEQIVNVNRAGNLLRAKFYVCPLCGNVIHATGEASISCCGIALPVLEVENAVDGRIPAAPENAAAADPSVHLPQVEVADGEVYLTMEHPMGKDHFISFMAYVTTDQVFFRKLYPEQTADARFPYRGLGIIFAYCNRHGLFACRTPRVQRKSTVCLM